MLDAIDLQILDLLQHNARIPQAEIARVVGLAPSAVLERLRKLEGRGVIRAYAAVLNPKALDQRLLAFVALRTTDRPGETRVAQTLLGVPEVLEIHHVAGDDCLLLKVRARDPEHLSQILRDRLGRSMASARRERPSCSKASKKPPGCPSTRASGTTR